jgi:hypothetical protein
MAVVLHLVKGAATPVAVETIRQQAAGGDAVTVVLLEGAPAPDLPAAARVRRAPDELSYGDLLDLIFQADQVVSW